jgi:hypothetical protein
MAGLKTVILGIGLPYYRCLTQMHAPEDLLGERFPIQVYNRRLSISLIDRQAQTHGYRLRVHKDGLRRNLGLLRELLNKMELQEWSYHGVPMFSTTARLVTGALTDAAWRGKSIYGRAPR